MKRVWSEENRFTCIVRAEIALSHAQGIVGMIPIEDAEIIEKNALSASRIRAKEIEAEISHDTMAITRAVAEVCGDAGRWIHFGATSNDILDTATGLQLKEAYDLFENKLETLMDVLLKRAGETKNLICIGRTHGQQGVPTTYGLRFAIWASEVSRHLLRLRESRPRVVIGKMTGAVGTMAAMGEHGIEVQTEMMKYLDIGSVDVSSQVISRDRYAEYIFLLANIATTLDKIGIEVRSLQRTEIGEVEESFSKKQVGSSTMPHKRNPIKSEQVCGLARIVRAMVEPALLNNTLWDERDLTNSSAERITFPETSILCDHCLQVMTGVVENLKINTEAVTRNLQYLHGINLAESVMIELTKRGMKRQDAHEIIREASMEALAAKLPLAEILSAKPQITSYVSVEEIGRLLQPETYAGLAGVQVENLIRKLAPYCTL
jgi:adenylosuccinate lyase